MQIKELTIIIPTYNDNDILRNNIDIIIIFFQKTYPLDLEIVIIDDGSTKNIVSFDYLCLAHKDVSFNILKNVINKGKGYALRKAINHASKKWLLITDADLSVSVNQFLNLQEYIFSFDIVIGSRALKNSVVKSNLLKIILGRVGSFLINLFLNLNVSDSQCGFKLFKTRDAQALFATSKTYRWSIDFEVLYLAKIQNLSIKEVPVIWRKSEHSNVKILDYFTTLIDLVKIRLIYTYKNSL